jgi:hypothetical protein
MNLKDMEGENVEWINLTKERPSSGLCQHGNKSLDCTEDG